MLTGDITWTDAATLAGVVGAAFAIWWRIQGRIDQVRSDAEKEANAAHAAGTLALTQLAEYKTHVAETYITKAGMKETTDQILGAVHGVRTDVHGLNERIDRILENRPRSVRP
jgi:hypothetical protein